LTVGQAYGKARAFGNDAWAFRLFIDAILCRLLLSDNAAQREFSR